MTVLEELPEAEETEEQFQAVLKMDIVTLRVSSPFPDSIS